MTLIKQNLSLNFSQGLDTKSDPKQIEVGKFFELENSIFQKGGLLQKRNGFGQLSPLPVTDSIYTTTFNTDLTAIGKSLYAYSNASNQWVLKGPIQPVSLTTTSLIKNSTNQRLVDAASSTNGLTCVVWQDQDPLNLANNIYRYSITDAVTGQSIVAPTTIPLADPVVGMPKVFFLGNHFVIIYTQFIAAVYRLQYFRISAFDVTQISGDIVIASTYGATAAGAFDGVVENNLLYVAYANTGVNSGISIKTISSTFVMSGASVFRAGDTAVLIKMTSIPGDNSPHVWVAYYSTAPFTSYAFAVNSNLSLLAGNTVRAGSGVTNMSISAISDTATVFFQVNNTYTYNAVRTDYIQSVTINESSVVGPIGIIVRSLGIASRSFIIDGVIYLLGVYQSPVTAEFQTGYFLINQNGDVIAKLANGNGYGYAYGLPVNTPTASINGNKVTIPYLIRETIEAETITSETTSTPGVYSQYGINQVTFTFNPESITSGEIGKNLHLSGGFVWAYDGSKPVEQGFFVFPENIVVTTAGVGGNIAADTYWYQVTYEWTDNQGNYFRSAPSLPVSILTTGATSANTINVPMLRLTYKADVRICVYRYSVALPVYHMIRSVTQPIINNPDIDSVAIVDTAANITIQGNVILYTTGGILENISPPATDNIALFDNRLWLIDAEDRNLLWFSKPVIQGTPVEMSDLLTEYVSPTTSAQGSTGVSTALAALDDKLIIFKANAIYYINGTGPDATGANSQYSQPTFVTATVGCINQNSIVFMPQGLMFQSDKGIWLLGRDLSTNYIGAPVETFNSATVKSALNIPATNQVRFTLDSGITLMYDYYYGQWGTFTNIPAVSSTLFENLHTFIDDVGRVFQETPGVFLDGPTAVTMYFKTAWMNLAGLQGYQRAYSFYLLGTYMSPHTLVVDVGYDYEEGTSQGFRISPDNFTDVYGTDPFYGDSLYYGGLSTLEQWRIFFERQKCQAFQISVQEVYDQSFGVAPGAGLTLSGINLVVGKKLGYTKLAAARQTG